MPEFGRTKDGKLKVYDQNQGRWRDATSVDTELARQPLLRGATVAAEGLTGLPGIGSPGLRQSLENSNPLTLGGLEAGSIGAGIGALGVMGAKGALGALRGGSRMAERVAQQMQPPRIMATMAEQQAQEIGAAVQVFGMDSVGAAAQSGFWEFLRARPALRDTLEGLENFIGTQRPLTPDQARLLASGNAERLGFQWLPGQRTGNNVISDIIRSQPFMADVLDPILAANARNLWGRVARAIGLTADDAGRGALQGGREAVGQIFEEVADRMPSVQFGDDIVNQLDELVLTPAERRAYGIEATEEGARRSLRAEGRDVMELRQKVAEEASNRAQREGQDRVQRTMTQTLEAIDETVERALQQAGDTETLRLWQEARARWRVVRALDAPGVVGPGGELSMKTLARSLEREFPEFRRQLAAPENLPADIRDLMDYTRLARAFESNLGDSGTATRSAMGDVINNPIKFMKQRAAARFLTDVILSNPERAAQMP